MDEFAERHTRERIVHDALGASISSAGVGSGTKERGIILVEQLGRFVLPSQGSERWDDHAEAGRSTRSEGKPLRALRS
jgi:hypothetical protein